MPRIPPAFNYLDTASARMEVVVITICSEEMKSRLSELGPDVQDAMFRALKHLAAADRHRAAASLYEKHLASWERRGALTDVRLSVLISECVTAISGSASHLMRARAREELATPLLRAVVAKVKLLAMKREPSLPPHAQSMLEEAMRKRLVAFDRTNAALGLSHRILRERMSSWPDEVRNLLLERRALMKEAQRERDRARQLELDAFDPAAAEETVEELPNLTVSAYFEAGCSSGSADDEEWEATLHTIRERNAKAGGPARIADPRETAASMIADLSAAEARPPVQLPPLARTPQSERIRTRLGRLRTDPGIR